MHNSLLYEISLGISRLRYRACEPGIVSLALGHTSSRPALGRRKEFEVVNSRVSVGLAGLARYFRGYSMVTFS